MAEQHSVQVEIAKAELVPVFAGMARSLGELATQWSGDFVVDMATHNGMLGKRSNTIGVYSPEMHDPAAYFTMSADNFGEEVTYNMAVDDEGLRLVRIAALAGEPTVLTASRSLMRAAAMNGELLEPDNSALQVHPKSRGSKAEPELLIDSARFVPVLAKTVQVLSHGALWCAGQNRTAQSQISAKFHSTGQVHRFATWQKGKAGRGRLYFESSHPDPDNGTRTSFEMTFGAASKHDEDEPERCSVMCSVTASYRGMPRPVYRDTLMQYGDILSTVRTRQLAFNSDSTLNVEYLGRMPANEETILHMAYAATVASALPPDVGDWGKDKQLA